MCRKAFSRSDFQQDKYLGEKLKTLQYSCKCGKNVTLSDLEYHEGSECATYSQEVSRAIAATKVRPD
jgi:hypothetical protein